MTPFIIWKIEKFRVKLPPAGVTATGNLYHQTEKYELLWGTLSQIFENILFKALSRNKGPTMASLRMKSTGWQGLEPVHHCLSDHLPTISTWVEVQRLVRTSSWVSIPWIPRTLYHLIQEELQSTGKCRRRIRRMTFLNGTLAVEE